MMLESLKLKVFTFNFLFDMILNTKMSFKKRMFLSLMDRHIQEHLHFSQSFGVLFSLEITLKDILLLEADATLCENSYISKILSKNFVNQPLCSPKKSFRFTSAVAIPINLFQYGCRGMLCSYKMKG